MKRRQTIKLSQQQILTKIDVFQLLMFRFNRILILESLDSCKQGFGLEKLYCLKYFTKLFIFIRLVCPLQHYLQYKNLTFIIASLSSIYPRRSFGEV